MINSTEVVLLEKHLEARSNDLFIYKKKKKAFLSAFLSLAILCGAATNYQSIDYLLDEEYNSRNSQKVMKRLIKLSQISR